MNIKLCFLPLLLSGGIAFAQNRTSLQVLSMETKEVVEYALVYNKATKKFTYSDAQGKAELEYSSPDDSVLFSIPGYKSSVLNVSRIHSLEDKIFLEPELQQLKEIEIVAEAPVYSCRESVKGKKNDITKIKSQGASIVSFLSPRCFDGTLKVIVFYVDPASVLPGGKTYLRPLLYKITATGKQVHEELLKIPSAVHAESGYKDGKIMIDVSASHVVLDNAYQYLIGFQLISYDQEQRELFFLSNDEKGHYSLISARPESPFGRLENHSLGYELYFAK